MINKKYAYDLLGFFSPLLVFISGYLITNNLSVIDRGSYANFQIMIGSCAYWSALGLNLTIPKYYLKVSSGQINTLVVASSLMAGLICNIIFSPTITIFLTAYSSASVLIVSSVYLTYTSTTVYYFTRFISQIIFIVCVIFLTASNMLNVENLLIAMVISNIIILSPFYWRFEFIFSTFVDAFVFIKDKMKYIFVSVQLWMLSAFDKFIFIYVLSENELAHYIVLLSVIQIPVTFSETLLPKVLNISLNSRKAPWLFIGVYIGVISLAIMVVGVNANYILEILYAGKYAGKSEMIIFICSLVFLRSCIKIIQEPLKLILDANKFFIINSTILFQLGALIGNHDFFSLYVKITLLAPLLIMLFLSARLLSKTSWSN